MSYLRDLNAFFNSSMASLTSSLDVAVAIHTHHNDLKKSLFISTHQNQQVVSEVVSEDEVECN